jgi:ribonuclease H2 subunit A
MDDAQSSRSYIIGIDEAGRGPVLGPMVYAALAFPADDPCPPELAGYEDSKALTPVKRERLFAALPAAALPEIRVISSAEICRRQFGPPGESLNDISFAAAFELIRRFIARGLTISRVVVDTVGRPEAYLEKLKREFSSHPGIRFTVESKADANYTVVGAASICAKVTRDRLVEHMHETYTEKFAAANAERAYPDTVPLPTTSTGSGYPGDPATKRWLVSNLDPVFGWPSNVRFSWKNVATPTPDLPFLPALFQTEDEPPTVDPNRPTTVAAHKAHLEKMTAFPAEVASQAAGLPVEGSFCSFRSHPSGWHWQHVNAL